MTKEEKDSSVIEIPEHERLLSLIAQLGGRTLYTRATRAKVGDGRPYREGCGRGYSSYRKVDGGAAESYLSDILPNCDFKFKTWTWFDPSPISLPEMDLEYLVQRRLMKPLTIESEALGAEQWRVEVFVVPESVLRRPVCPETGYYYGEPWCKQCNETFFWSPNVKEEFHSPVYQGALCHGCLGRMPVEYNRPANYETSRSWQAFMARRAVNRNGEHGENS